MADFKDIIGQEAITEHFISAIQRGQASHAYIINGDALSGKKMIAAAFAKALQCEEKTGNACNHCQSCMQAESHNHPDIIWVGHEKPNSIGVDDIRKQVNGDIAIKPYSSEHKIYIINEAEKMTEQAQNALLKTIEEPPSYGVILLLTANKGKLLDTIRSRCVQLDMKPVSQDTMKTYLIEKLNLSEEKAAFCVGFSMGNLGKAIHLSLEEHFNEIKEDCIRLLKNIDEMQLYELIDAVKYLTKYKLEIYDYLDFMTLWYRDVLLLKATGDANTILYKEEYSSLSRITKNCSYEGIEKILAEIEKAKTRLRANVNFDLTMELLFLTIKEN